MLGAYLVRDLGGVLDEVQHYGVLANVVGDVIDLLAADPFNHPPWNALSIVRYPDPGWPDSYTVALGEHGFLLYRVDVVARIIDLWRVVLV